MRNEEEERMDRRRISVRPASLPLLVGQAEANETARIDAICRDYINGSSSTTWVTFPPAPLPIQNALQGATTCIGTEALQRRPPSGVEFFVSSRAIAGA